MVPRAGPYIFYFCALVTSGDGNLTLSQGNTTISFKLSASDSNTCVRDQRVISLYEKKKVTFRFIKNGDAHLQDLRVGLHYLLGDVYFLTPELD